MKIIELSKNTVIVLTENDVTTSFVNSTRGRAQLEAECPDEIVKQVYEVWGKTPTVEEPTFPEQSASISPSETDQLRADVDYICAMTGVTL